MRVEVRVSPAPGKVEYRRIGKISSVFPRVGQLGSKSKSSGSEQI
jgi:hypothetical protein